MSDNFGSDFITISDEEGNSYELEHLDTMEIDGKYYLAFVPADMDEKDEHYGMIILRQDGEEGDEYLILPEDDELEEVYGKFMERLFTDEDEDEGEE